MGRTKKVGKAGKFGSRYGLRIRRRYLKAESKKSDVCPSCDKKQLKRLASGIWECKKCGVKYAAGAYSPKVVQQ